MATPVSQTDLTDLSRMVVVERESDDSWTINAREDGSVPTASALVEPGSLTGGLISAARSEGT